MRVRVRVGEGERVTGHACNWCASEAESSAEARRSEGTRSAAWLGFMGEG